MFYPNHPFATDNEFVFTGCTIHPDTDTRFDTYVHIRGNTNAYACVSSNEGADYAYMELDLVNVEFQATNAKQYPSSWGSHIAYCRALAHLANVELQPRKPKFMVVVQHDDSTPDVHGPFTRFDTAQSFALACFAFRNDVTIEIDETVTLNGLAVTLTEANQA